MSQCTPLVCTSTGGMGREATVFSKRLACHSLGTTIQLNHPAQPSTGYDVDCPLPCFDQLFCMCIATWKQVFCA